MKTKLPERVIPIIIPLPREPRHQRFADLMLAGKSMVEAYLTAGFRCTRQAAKTGATKIRKRPDVVAYMHAIQERAADDSCLSVMEKRRFLARIVRTPLMSIDPNDPNHKDGDLILKYKRTESETGSHQEIVKLDPLKAIAEDNKLSGDDPEANALQQMAEAFSRLGNLPNPLPADRM